MSRAEAIIYLITSLIGFAIFTWLFYKFMVYVFKTLNEKRGR